MPGAAHEPFASGKRRCYREVSPRRAAPPPPFGRAGTATSPGPGPDKPFPRSAQMVLPHAGDLRPGPDPPAARPGRGPGAPRPSPFCRSPSTPRQVPVSRPRAFRKARLALSWPNKLVAPDKDKLAGAATPPARTSLVCCPPGRGLRGLGQRDKLGVQCSIDVRTTSALAQPECARRVERPDPRPGRHRPWASTPRVPARGPRPPGPRQEAEAVLTPPSWATKTRRRRSGLLHHPVIPDQGSVDTTGRWPAPRAVHLRGMV